jgi:transmembrane sensor
MDEKQFAELIERFLAGQATAEESTLVEKWLDQRAAHDPFGKLSAVEKDEIRRKTLEELSSKITVPVKPIERNRNRNPIFFYRAAAAVSLLAVLSFAILQFPSHPERQKITTVKSVSTTNSGRKVILSDSSIIWLKANSAISYPRIFSANERRITLAGEALFEVTRDAKHPFIIQCGSLRAKVLGTSFNIKSSESHIEVLVLTGKVSLSSEGNTKGLIVYPNEKAVYDEKENQIAMVNVEDTEKIAKTAGTEYSMQFQATRMKEIVRRIEGKFNVKVSLSDERLNNCTITADFTDQSFDRTLSLISETLGITYVRENNRVMLKGEGCD